MPTNRHTISTALPPVRPVRTCMPAVTAREIAHRAFAESVRSNVTMAAKRTAGAAIRLHMYVRDAHAPFDEAETNT